MNNNKELFSAINYGTQITTSTYDTVEVTIDPSFMVGDFGIAYARDCERRNPIKYAKLFANITDPKSGEVKSVKIDEDILSNYFKQIIIFRVRSVADQTVPWRQMKQLVMPAWIQYVISTVGKVYDKENGLLFIPVCQDDDVMSIEDMLSISVAIEIFSNDGKHFFNDAFPREKTGDHDVMSMAIINQIITGSDKLAAPIASYVAGFLGMKLAEETSYKARYRVQYDDAEFVRSMLMNDGRILE